MTRKDLKESRAEIKMHIDQVKENVEARIKGQITGLEGEIKGKIKGLEDKITGKLKV